ncbi:MAG: glutathionylspermidine synthase family protein [Deltaproteobacteria bacterium]|nr:glutathionylspermidine synthase family protein [Deltaproteobacteria bacterium]
MDYEAFARQITASGIVTDPWLAGEPRFREDAVVVPAAEARAMYRAAESIAEVYNELCLIVADEPELLDTFFALSPYQKAMWLASQPLWHGIARADVFATSEGLQIAELNCDTPTGEAEAIVLGPLAARAGTIDPNRDLAARFGEIAEMIWRATLKEKVSTLPKRAGIVYPTELPEDLSLVRLYKRTFEERGFEIVLGSPYNLSHDPARGLLLFDEPISLVLRHYKTDWWGERQSAWDDEDVLDPQPLEEPLEAVLAAMLEGTCAVVNPFGAVVPQNKRAMAFMWEQIHRFSRRAQEIIRAHVPPTRRLEAFHKEQLAAQKDEWVLKSDYGAEGDEVVIGRLVSAEEWTTALAHARKNRWIVQRYFRAHEGPRGESVNYGVFLLGGEACGLYARVQIGATDVRALSAPALIAS